MIAKISVSTEQIRWYAQAALNVYETLDVETAAEVAQSKLRALILYLEAFDNTDNAIAVNIKSGVKPIIVLENVIGNSEGRD
jgi:hypothetical protein